MEIIRATKEWQRAGVHFVRTQAMCEGFQIPLEREFEGDEPDDEYILALDGIKPVSTCRIGFIDNHIGKIERVATLEEYRGQHYGAAVIKEAEKWMAEKGIDKVQISAREAALGFYQKLGYIPDYNEVSGEGDFRCILTYKELKIKEQ